MRNYHYLLRHYPESAFLVYFVAEARNHACKTWLVLCCWGLPVFLLCGYWRLEAKTNRARSCTFTSTFKAVATIKPVVLERSRSLWKVTARHVTSSPLWLGALWLSPVLMPLAWKIVVFCKYQSLLSVLRPCYQSRMPGQCPTHLHVLGWSDRSYQRVPLTSLICRQFLLSVQPALTFWSRNYFFNFSTPCT